MGSCIKQDLDRLNLSNFHCAGKSGSKGRITDVDDRLDLTASMLDQNGQAFGPRNSQVEWCESLTDRFL